ncbi:FAD-dependent monooxygenase (plasmid) [Streptomyces sp. NBC_00390]|uniref:FAD-dependent monooxygenase n=1 Tax=Streptomyces sp. NBC_00390 TaxID=2975736 RepID=UPI002E1B52E9
MDRTTNGDGKPSELRADVCIVGGGPAGLTLALLLLRSGAEVALIERSASLDREFRGEILQPGGLALLDELGVLEGAVARGGYPLDRFRLQEDGRTLLDIDYRRLPGPHNHMLSIPQRHLLEELLTSCRAYPGFVHLEGHRATALLRSGGTVIGAVARSDAGSSTVHALCVVGADGRYSKVRRLAGIEAGRIEAFDFDVLWLKVPAPGGRRTPAAARLREVGVTRSGGNPVLVYPSWPDSVQIGWTLPHRSYTAAMDEGFAAVRDAIARAVPDYADAVHAELRTMKDLTLLDVFAGSARTWVQDGLVLIGDAAHTHSPLGAQGINLAVQDAALLHPVLVEALRTRDVTSQALGRYEVARRPAIDAVMKFQVMQGRMMLARGGVAARLRPMVARAISRTPIGAKLTRRVAYGSSPVRLRTDLFNPPVLPPAAR